eukprot:TRINITY_DN110957_c0_g1_i1.p1 TRINITY_DN110957_c0_g1~~TRINITY_DN110957_c0_g1_i1.p1  ORF type:complete len:640 (+),score=124.51 TRINITY_DN110957_c0_g1_i1:71-1921(+)
MALKQAQIVSALLAFSCLVQCCTSYEEAEEEVHGLSLLQLSSSAFTIRVEEPGPDANVAKFTGTTNYGISADAKTSCSPLKNHGTFSSINVKVGTPPQNFDLVADTGSDNVIVQSCICKKGGYCPEEYGKCFTGTDQSSTFFLPGQNAKHPVQSKVPVVQMTFGSGTIAAIIASDQVAVGKESAYMNSSLLLMVRQALTIQGQFEGILGLGRPHKPVIQASNVSEKEDESGLVPKPAVPKIQSFLEAANVDRFSMCFNYNTEGVLALNTPNREDWLGSVGQLHWGLDFRGISVGGRTVPVSFCTPEEKAEGADTACGIIPDSGTTQIMGPKVQIAKLFDDLCRKWKRCNDTHKKLVKMLHDESARKQDSADGLSLAQEDEDSLDEDPTMGDIVQALKAAMAKAMKERGTPSGGSTAAASSAQNDASGIDGVGDAADSVARTPKLERYETFQLLLHNCAQWKNSTDIDKEMPPVFFHVAGTEGKTQTLKLMPYDYVSEVTGTVMEKHRKTLLGILPIYEIVKKTTTVCAPAFGVMEYPTLKNGPVWIFGTPLFYSHQVHYDRSSKPPAMAFTHGSCGSCVDSRPVAKIPTSLVAESERMRKISGEWREPSIDVTQPF